MWATERYEQSQDRLLAIKFINGTKEVVFQGGQAMSEIRTVEGKTLIRCGENLHLFDHRTSEISLVSSKCDKFEVLKNHLLVRCKEGIELVKIKFEDPKLPAKQPKRRRN